MTTEARTTMIGTLLTVLFVTGNGVAHADIRSMGNICHPTTLPETGVVWNDHGIQNVSSARQGVTCPIPRSNVAANTPATFIIEGQNPTGTVTNCFLITGNPSNTGAVLEFFDLSGPSSRALISLSPARITNTDFVEVTCSLAPGVNNVPGAALVGVTAVGP